MKLIVTGAGLQAKNETGISPLLHVQVIQERANADPNSAQEHECLRSPDHMLQQLPSNLKQRLSVDLNSYSMPI